MSSDNWAINAALVATSALALASNALLILVFFRRRGLRTVSNRFVINLLITNLLSSLVLIPLLLADQELKITNIQGLKLKDVNTSSQLTLENINLAFNQIDSNTTESNQEFELKVINYRDEILVENLHRGNYSYDYIRCFLCYLSEGSTNLVCTASILSILLIAIDQYFAVTHPLRYHTFIDKVKSLKLLVSTWVVSGIFGVIGSFVRTEDTSWNFCPKIIPTDNQVSFNIIYSFVYLIVVITIPFLIICVIYFCIYCAAHKNSQRMRKSNSGNSSTNLDIYVQIPLDESKIKVKGNSSDNLTVETPLPVLPKVKSAPNFANLENKNSQERITTESIRSNSSFISSIKTKISNASLFRYREETRAAKISILVIFMVLICYVPYGLTLIFNTKILISTPRYFNSLSLSLLVLANLLSPFLFAYRNRRIQRELRRLFGLLPTRIPKELRSIRERRSSQKVENTIPEVVVTEKIENEKKSILKRVCSKGKTWQNKKCNFIPVESCLNVECRCSFSSASTQISSEEYSCCS